MVDAVGIEQRRTTLDTVNGVALAEQQSRKISTILAGYASNQGDFAHTACNFWLGILTGPRELWAEMAFPIRPHSTTEMLCAIVTRNSNS
jgi:hypothetical protein